MFLIRTLVLKIKEYSKNNIPFVYAIALFISLIICTAIYFLLRGEYLNIELLKWLSTFVLAIPAIVTYIYDKKFKENDYYFKELKNMIEVTDNYNKQISEIVDNIKENNITIYDISKLRNILTAYEYISSNHEFQNRKKSIEECQKINKGAVNVINMLNYEGILAALHTGKTESIK
ncbi:hypothetical protein [Gemella cuniculi]|uniref:hypothetical protein n=1 Tax=Gemella cuniculi TaxID=150240 RepID=UPI0003F83D0A|nr:hypothetical protein [Gemella cuniculi]